MLHLRVLDDVQTKIPEFITQEEVGEINLQKNRGWVIEVENLCEPNQNFPRDECYACLV